MKVSRDGSLFHVQYPSQKELAKAFCRFQEHYENPKFRGEIFTLGQLREWYSLHRGAWTYYDDWNGFNFPSYVLDPFKAGMFDPLSRAEKRLLNALKSIPGKFYVIGTHEKDESTEEVLKHEKLHALYYTNPAYKADIDAYFDLIFPAKLSPLRNHLRELGYHEAVIQDEMQAYMGASTSYLKSEGIEYPQVVSERIKEIARQHWPDLVL